MFLDKSQKVFAVAAVAVNTTGTTYKIERSDNSPEATESWYLLGKVTQAGGATSPTGTLHIEFSVDGTTWIRKPLDGGATDADETLYPVLKLDYVARYIRIILVVTGATAPNMTVDLWLGTSADYKFTAV